MSIKKIILTVLTVIVIFVIYIVYINVKCAGQKHQLDNDKRENFKCDIFK